MDVDRASGAAQRRRERRLRAAWQHEQQLIATALGRQLRTTPRPSESTGEKEARTREKEERETNQAQNSSYSFHQALRTVLRRRK